MRMFIVGLLLSGCYSAEVIYEDGEKVESCEGNDHSTCWIPGNRACINGRCVSVDEHWTGQVNWFCGDGTADPDEECDEGRNNNGDYNACTLNCLNAVCGDGLLRTDLDADESDFESCDDGNRQDGDGCSVDCGFE